MTRPTRSVRRLPCEVAGVLFTPPTVPLPDLVSADRVLGAGVLMAAHQYGTVLHYFDAVDRARELLDTAWLCIDDNDVLNRLYCWPEEYQRLDAAQRGRLAAKVLGIPDPYGDESARDQLIQPMLTALLDAVNAVCDPGPLRTAPTAAAEGTLARAELAVRSRLSQSMTGLTTLRVRDLQVQLTFASDLLTELAPELPVPCRPGSSSGADIWGTLEFLVGDQLRADGVDLVSAAEVAAAWQVVFAALDTPAQFVTSTMPSALCQAVALLRPPGYGAGGSACCPPRAPGT